MNGIMKYINRISRCNGSCLRKPSARVWHYPVPAPIHPADLSGNRVFPRKRFPELCVNKSSVTRQITLMEEKGLIMQTGTRPTGGYGGYIPPRRCQELLPHVRLVMREWNEYLLEEFSEEEQEKLVVALKN